jgi:hypothetical protein
MHLRQSSSIAARMRKASDIARVDRVAVGCEYDRDGARRCFGSSHLRRRDREDEFNPEVYEFSRQSWQTLQMTFGKAVLNHNILTDAPPAVLEFLVERSV